MSRDSRPELESWSEKINVVNLLLNYGDNRMNCCDQEHLNHNISIIRQSHPHTINTLKVSI